MYHHPIQVYDDIYREGAPGAPNVLMSFEIVGSLLMLITPCPINIVQYFFISSILMSTWLVGSFL